MIENQPNKYIITVCGEPDPIKSNTTNVTLYFHKDSAPMNTNTMMHLLCSAVSLCIKSMDKAGIKKDYESVKEAIDHIQNEFVGLNCFDDAALFKNEKNIDTEDE